MFKGRLHYWAAFVSVIFAAGNSFFDGYIDFFEAFERVYFSLFALFTAAFIEWMVWRLTRNV